MGFGWIWLLPALMSPARTRSRSLPRRSFGRAFSDITNLKFPHEQAGLTLIQYYIYLTLVQYCIYLTLIQDYIYYLHRPINAEMRLFSFSCLPARKLFHAWGKLRKSKQLNSLLAHQRLAPERCPPTRQALFLQGIAPSLGNCSTPLGIAQEMQTHLTVPEEGSRDDPINPELVLLCIHSA